MAYVKKLNKLRQNFILIVLTSCDYLTVDKVL